MTKKTILLVDDDDDFLRVLTRRCENVGLEVEQTSNFLNAALMTAKSAPDMICVDVHMPASNGLSFGEALGADRDVSQIPIVVLTSRNDLQTHQACAQLHAYYVEKTDDYWSTLKPILRRLAAEAPDKGETQRCGVVSPGLSAELVRPFSTAKMTECSGKPGTKKILVADDDDDMVDMLSQRCSALGCSVIGVTNALDAINEIHRLTPDMVILDVNMPSGSGLSVCDMMAADERLQDIPIVVLTGRSDESTIRRCSDLLAYYVHKCANTWERVEPLVRELMQIEGSISSTHRAATELSASFAAAYAPGDEAIIGTHWTLSSQSWALVPVKSPKAPAQAKSRPFPSIWRISRGCCASTTIWTSPTS